MVPVKRIFESFPSVNHAKILTDVLDGKMEYEVEIDNKPISEFYIGQSTALPVHVKLNPAQFAEARRLWESEIMKSDNQEWPEYLTEMDNEELLSGLKQDNNLSVFDQIGARQILKQRGVEVNDHWMEQARDTKLTDSSKPIAANFSLLFLGYTGPFLLVLTSYLFHHPILYWTGICLALGIIIRTNKKTLSNGERVLVFDQSSRTHGLVIVVINGVALLYNLLSIFLPQLALPYMSR